MSAFLGTGVKGFKRVFDIDEKPVRSIGVIVVLFVTLVYVLAAPWVLN